jgi:WW domain-containing oxidoreductase
MSPKDPDGTIIITGANGSLALSFVEYLLGNYPSYFAILTVRDDSKADPNTTKLRNIVSRFQSAKVSVEALDFASLSNVRSFAEKILAQVSTGEIPPISAIVCNAFAWSLTDTKYSKDGYELGFQVSHLSHFVLVLKLIGSMNKETGRLVFLGSEAHDSKNKNGFNPLGAMIPEDLEEIFKPKEDKKGEEMSRGFQRYSNSKMANVMFMHALNRKLQQVGFPVMEKLFNMSDCDLLTGSNIAEYHGHSNGSRRHAHLSMFCQSRSILLVLSILPRHREGIWS